MYVRVMPLEFCSSLVLEECPVHRFALEIACVSPEHNLSTQSIDICYTAVQTLGRECREFDLSLIEPRSFFRSVMRLKTLRQSESLLGREDLIERTRGVGVEIVLNETDMLDLRVV